MADDDTTGGKLARGEYLAMAGGALLAIGVFLPWYGVTGDLGVLNGVRGIGAYSAWDAHPAIRWLLLLAAIAPFVLAWIVASGTALSWPRGEVTMVISLIAGMLIIYSGIIDRPGEPHSLVELRWGWFVALLGVILMFVGAVSRQREVSVARKPPGVL